MSTKINQHMNAADIAILVILSVLWGGSFFFIEVLVDHLPPLTIVTARVGLAALILWMIIVAQGISVQKSASDWGALFTVGFLNNALPFCLIVWGQTQISSGLASVLNATTPFFTVLIAGAVLADEQITKNKILGVIVGVVGVAVLIGPEAFGGVTGSLVGQVTVMGAALSYAFAGVYSRRFKERGLSPIMVATGQVSTAFLMLLPLMLWVDQPWTLVSPSLVAWSALIGLAVLSTVVAYILYFRLIDTAGATNAALVTFLIPISAIVLGVVVLGERFTLLQGLGMSLVGMGLLIMDGRLFKRG